MWAPRATPKDVLAKIHEITVKTLADPGVRARLDKLGDQVSPPAMQNPEVFAAFQKAEAAKWWPLIKAANIKPG